MWNPTAPEGISNPFDQMPPKESDLYLTVDEIDGNRVRLVVSSWPSVDSENRLLFPLAESESEELLDDPTDFELIVDGGDLHSKVTQHRTSHRQPAPDRPLRVGDSFWFRPGDLEAAAPIEELAGDLVDVTYAARSEAKAAMAWAVTGSSDTPASLITAGAELDEEEGQEGPETPQQESGEPGRPSVPGSVASPSV
ncbi:MAG TPA: hypothetical protein VJA46_00480 [Acidimicrobiia bacterium]|nr:hypothetical protein [Acidimicrobiia bacterium]